MFEIDHVPPRPEGLIREDILSRQQMIDMLRNKEYFGSNQHIPYDDWMGSCDGDKDYEAFWGRLADQREIEAIETIEIPALEKELARTKRMTE